MNRESYRSIPYGHELYDTGDDASNMPLRPGGHAIRRSRFSGLKSFVLMVALLVSAIAAALGQHFYYSYLNGRLVNEVAIDQSWAIRLGTALAFFVKACLVSAVGAAFSQAFWFSVRRNAIRIDGLDAMFGVLQNPLNFFNSDLLFKATRLVIFAAICWLLPISAILSTGALTGVTSHSLN
jgi:hypothetical protein